MGTKHMVVAALTSALVVVGCGTSEHEWDASTALGTTEAQLSATNGTGLNGTGLNGTGLNGTGLNGTGLSQQLVSVRYAGAKLQGMSTAMDEVWLEASVFHGLQGTDEYSGTDFSQVRFVGNLDDGGTVPLRIDSVVPGTGAEQDVWTYSVSYQDPSSGQWYPICRNADGTVANAIPLEGRWNYSQGVAGGGSKIDDMTTFTFACEGLALAKCVHFGYKPWESVNGVSLADYHQTCTRMIRADFCGNGTSYTANGNWVNLYDALSVQADTETWGKEAQWNAQGATCFTSHTRATTTISCGEKLVTSCGESFSSNTLLISEVP